MKNCFAASISLLLLCASAILAAQDEIKPVHRTLFVESRQGNHPDGPDMIRHAAVAKDDTLMCMLVEVYDETHKASTACIVNFKNGSKRTLAFNQFMKVASETEISLECSGDMPRRCMIEVNDPANQAR